MIFCCHIIRICTANLIWVYDVFKYSNVNIISALYFCDKVFRYPFYMHPYILSFTVWNNSHVTIVICSHEMNVNDCMGHNIYDVFLGFLPNLTRKSHWKINSCHDKVRLNSHNPVHMHLIFFCFLTFTCELPVMLSTWLVATNNTRDFLAFFSLNVSVRWLWNGGLRYWGCCWTMI